MCCNINSAQIPQACFGSNTQGKKSNKPPLGGMRSFHSTEKEVSSFHSFYIREFDLRELRYFIYISLSHQGINRKVSSMTHYCVTPCCYSSRRKCCTCMQYNKVQKPKKKKPKPQANTHTTHAPNKIYNRENVAGKE